MSATTGPLTILITGATGYIGGSVLTRLLTHPNAKSFDITLLVRSADKAKLFETKFGVKAVVGGLADEELVESAAEKAHVVIECADCDDLKGNKTILRGLKRRHEKTGDVPIFVHTSGTGTLTSDDRGLKVSETTYDDLNSDQIETLPPTAWHRAVDLAIVEADKEGYIKSYIILPSNIFSLVSTPFVEAGIQNNKSICIPMLIKVALARGEAGVVGKGVSLWGYVDIDDTADFYIILLDAILSKPDEVGHGRDGYYFLANAEVSWYDISKTIGEILHKKGRVQSHEATTFTPEELVKYFGTEAFASVFGSTSRPRANRARSLGWNPKKTGEDMLVSLEPEVENVINSEGNKEAWQYTDGWVERQGFQDK